MKSPYKKKFLLALTLPSILVLLISGAYHLYLFINYDFNLDYLKIENCFEENGCWDRYDQMCRTLTEPGALARCKRFK